VARQDHGLAARGDHPGDRLTPQPASRGFTSRRGSRSSPGSPGGQ
jgi:hypothetical protein